MNIYPEIDSPCVRGLGAFLLSDIVEGVHASTLPRPVWLFGRLVVFFLSSFSLLVAIIEKHWVAR